MPWWKEYPMKNLFYNLNSVEVSYGDDTLTTVIQIDERITDIAECIQHLQGTLPDVEQRQIMDRLEKLVELNQRIREELEQQVERLNTIKMEVNREITLDGVK
jgi:chromosome segregation ATPase